MNCRFVTKHSFEFLEGELECHVEAQVEEHLTNCLNCQEHLAQSRSLLGHVREPEEIEIPAHFLLQIKHRILQENVEDREPLPIEELRMPWFQFLRQPRMLAVSGASVAVALGLFFVRPCANTIGDRPLVNMAGSEAQLPIPSPMLAGNDVLPVSSEDEEAQRQQIRKGIELLEAQSQSPMTPYTSVGYRH